MDVAVLGDRLMFVERDKGINAVLKNGAGSPLPVLNITGLKYHCETFSSLCVAEGKQKIKKYRNKIRD